MSDTPKTDAASFLVSQGDPAEWAVPLEIALKLERERNNLQDQRDFCMGEIERLRKERDEAVKSELAAIEAWDEERKRAIREGERVVEEREKYFAMRGLNNNATELAEKYKREREEAREALRDMLSGWKYIRQVHGDLYGVGWDRAQSKAEKALEAAK